MIDLTNKIAIVTGGRKGIGESVSTILAQQGAIVHILDIDKENGGRVSKSICNSNNHAYFHYCDYCISVICHRYYPKKCVNEKLFCNISAS